MSSVGTVFHGQQNASGWHLAPCHRWCRRCDSPTHYWDFSSNQRELALGADAGCLVLSWNHSKTTPCLLVRHKYRHTNHQTITPLRRCRLNLSLRLSAWHTTRTRRDPRRGSRPRHAHRIQGTRAGRGAGGRTRRASYFGSSSSRRRRRGPWGVLELPEIQQPPENEARHPATRPIVI